MVYFIKTDLKQEESYKRRFCFRWGFRRTLRWEKFQEYRPRSLKSILKNAQLTKKLDENWRFLETYELEQENKN